MMSSVANEWKVHKVYTLHHLFSFFIGKYQSLFMVGMWSSVGTAILTDWGEEVNKSAVYIECHLCKKANPPVT